MVILLIHTYVVYSIYTHLDCEGDREINVELLKCPKINEIPELLRKIHDVSGHDGINSTFRTISKEY